MSDAVLLQRTGHVATVSLNRPDRLNALDSELMDALLGILGDVAGDSDTRAVILTGAGKAFSAGGDLNAVLEGRIDHSQLRRREGIVELIHDMPKPVLAAVNGAAAGAGFSLALACDLRMAAKDARFTTAFIKVGFSGDFGGTWTLPRLVGDAKARELYFLSDSVDAVEAERIGLVNWVIEPSELHDRAMATAQRLAGSSPLAMARLKQNLNFARTSTFAGALDSEAEAIQFLADTEDNREAVQAFLEKRSPEFKGR